MKDEGQTFEELVSLARVADEAQLDDEDNEEYWHLVWILANRGDRETLDKSLALTRGDAFERSFAASVLGRLGVPERYSSTEITDALLELLTYECDDDVIAALVSSLGQHQENDERIPKALQRFLEHPDDDIRWCLAAGLGTYETPEAAAMLITLTADESANVRDWATFGLRIQENLDSSDIRNALIARLDDEYLDTRVEAIYALALRGDPRVVPAVLLQFDDSAKSELFDSLADSPSYLLLPALQKMAKDPSYAGDATELHAAIEKCEAYLQQNENQN